MSDPTPDLIDQLAGLAPDSPVAALRREKPDLVAFAQGSDQSLLEPADPGDLSLLERHAVAYRVGLLTGFPAVEKRHRRRLLDFGRTDLASHIERYPDVKLEPRLAALMRHTDLVTLRPGDAGPEDIAALHAAGLTPAAVVTLGQLLGYLGYQIRAIAVARAFAEGPELVPAPAKDRPQADASTAQRHAAPAPALLQHPLRLATLDRHHRRGGIDPGAVAGAGRRRPEHEERIRTTCSWRRTRNPCGSARACSTGS